MVGYSYMNQAILQELKASLEKERDKLAAELRSVADPDPRLAGDWDARFPQMETVKTASHSTLEESADEVEEYEVRLESEHSLESRLLAVTHALERIRGGTYGLCQKCRKDIPLERLRANPAAEFDMEHSA